jgi:hypothetical protein
MDLGPTPGLNVRLRARSTGYDIRKRGAAMMSKVSATSPISIGFKLAKKCGYSLFFITARVVSLDEQLPPVVLQISHCRSLSVSAVAVAEIPTTISPILPVLGGNVAA